MAAESMRRLESQDITDIQNDISHLEREIRGIREATEILPTLTEALAKRKRDLEEWARRNNGGK